ncbi:RGS domain-containing protein [Trichoderma velutinum]
MDTICPRRPTLREILLNVSPPPWTLRTFNTHLFQRHCEESLQFNQDAENYTVFYDQLVGESRTQRDRRVISLWKKLMQLYIAPCGPRQINISHREREHLLKLPCEPQPPHPSELDESRKDIYNLMNDSLLGPFLDLVSPMQHKSEHGQHTSSTLDVYAQTSITRDAPQVTSYRQTTTSECQVEDGRVEEGRMNDGNKELHRSKSTQHTPSRWFRYVIAVYKKYWERIRNRAMSYI